VGRSESAKCRARCQSIATHWFRFIRIGTADFSAPDQIIQLGNPPNRIDVLTALTGVEFAQCYAARVRVIVEGIRVNVINARHLKKNKRAAGRPQDLADVASLEQTRSARNPRR
jgi:hypothetical protein